MIHRREVRAIREAKNNFDDLFKLALTSDLPEVQALARQMKLATDDMLFGLCGLYRACDHDDDPMFGMSHGISAALEGGR